MRARLRSRLNLLTCIAVSDDDITTKQLQMVPQPFNKVVTLNVLDRGGKHGWQSQSSTVVIQIYIVCTMLAIYMAGRSSVANKVMIIISIKTS